ncbi:hypothetical protein PR048_002743 [Dryococelus australis]|uniref:Uncharacterized protein n=1 Tax=Dryococelus australis TaxID=614101 RepID=A0ABQ9ILQ5_9NEOP|nr:hypothetical protein PR048_002743 [Dryococelus australis]
MKGACVCIWYWVAPLKQVSLPRLELYGAHLQAKLNFYCHNFLSQCLHITATHAWIDSSVALAWIMSLPYLLKTFAANRMSLDNLSDCASRGLLPPDLFFHNLWWHGPCWLVHPPKQWPRSTVSGHDDNIAELKYSQLALLNTHEIPEELPLFPVMVCFIRRAKTQPCNSGSLTSLELDEDAVPYANASNMLDYMTTGNTSMEESLVQHEYSEWHPFLICMVCSGQSNHPLQDEQQLDELAVSQELICLHRQTVNMTIEVVPQMFNWIEIGAVWGPGKNLGVLIVLFQPRADTSSHVAGSINMLEDQVLSRKDNHHVWVEVIIEVRFITKSTRMMGPREYHENILQTIILSPPPCVHAAIDTGCRFSDVYCHTR